MMFFFLCFLLFFNPRLPYCPVILMISTFSTIKSLIYLSLSLLFKNCHYVILAFHVQISITWSRFRPSWRFIDKWSVRAFHKSIADTHTICFYYFISLESNLLQYGVKCKYLLRYLDYAIVSRFCLRSLFTNTLRCLCTERIRFTCLRVFSISFAVSIL